MEEAVRDQTDISRGFIVEMVPVQELMEYSFIYESNKSKAEQKSWPKIERLVHYTVFRGSMIYLAAVCDGHKFLPFDFWCIPTNISAICGYSKVSW